jgi:Phage integrase family
MRSSGCFKLAATKPEWQNARLAALLALNTTMRAGEIRGLRWHAVDLIERTITVRRNTTKTDAGERVIPLNIDSLGCDSGIAEASQAPVRSGAAARLVRLSARTRLHKA